MKNNLDLKNRSCRTGGQNPERDRDFNISLWYLVDDCHDSGIPVWFTGRAGQKTFQAPDGAKLKRLECSRGKLTNLDVSHLKNLVYLDAEENHLKKADVSGNLELGICMLNGNSLGKLVVNKNSSHIQKKMYQAIIKRNGGKLVYKG